MKINWQALGSVGSSLISGLFGQIGQRQQLNQSLQQQKYAFQKNKELAALQNAYNVAQWNRENQYNSPLNQMRRLKEAGLNPDLMYGNGISGLTAASSPSMSAGSPMSPIDMTMGGRRKTIGDIMHESLQDGLTAAQIDVMRSQARKNNADAGGQEIHNKSIFELDRAEIEERLASRDLSRQHINESIQRIENLKTEAQQIVANIDLIGKQIQDIDFKQSQDRLRLAMEQVLNDAQVKRLQAAANLDDTQADRLSKMLIPEINNLVANTQLTIEQKYKVISDKLYNWARTHGVLKENNILSLEEFSIEKIMSGSGKEVVALFTYVGQLISSILPILGKPATKASK